MPQIGPLEILVVGFAALLVFGPEKLPEMARSIGKWMHQTNTMASNLKSEFDTSLADDHRASPEEITTPTDRSASEEVSGRAGAVASGTTEAAAIDEGLSDIVASR